MRISGGLSEIALSIAPGDRTRSEKIFVWPLYNSGTVHKTQGVTGRTRSDSIYSKPTIEDHFRLLSIAHSSPEGEYNAWGRLVMKNLLTYRPGSFFDAIV
jgi:hypothetical protein